MLIVIDPNSGVPVYRQIVDQVRFQIASGRAAPAEELPSTRALSEQLGVNPMTVSKAYALLEEAGLVRRRPGLPLVVAPLAGEAADAEKTAQLRQVLAPAAVAARQLGLGHARAVAVFRQLMTELEEDQSR